MSSWFQLANEQLILVGQWAADFSWPISSWFQLANEQLISVGQWAADFRWLMSSWHQYGIVTWRNSIKSRQSAYRSSIIKTQKRHRLTDRQTDMCNPTDAIASNDDIHILLIHYIYFQHKLDLGNWNKHFNLRPSALAGFIWMFKVRVTALAGGI